MVVLIMYYMKGLLILLYHKLYNFSTIVKPTDGVSLLRRFDYAHNTMGLTHSQLVQFPHVLLSRDFRLRQRHAFLRWAGPRTFCFGKGVTCTGFYSGVKTISTLQR